MSYASGCLHDGQRMKLSQFILIDGHMIYRYSASAAYSSFKHIINHLPLISIIRPDPC